MPTFRTKGQGKGRKVYPLKRLYLGGGKFAKISAVLRPKISSLHKKFVPHLKRSGLVDLKWIGNYWNDQGVETRALLLESAKIVDVADWYLDDWKDLPVEVAEVLAEEIVEENERLKLKHGD